MNDIKKQEDQYIKQLKKIKNLQFKINEEKGKIERKLGKAIIESMKLEYSIIDDELINSICNSLINNPIIANINNTDSKNL